MAEALGFRDVKAGILDRIRGGDWPPGTRIPNEVELAETLGCARATVSRAMRELADDGVLDRRRRAGTWVATSPVRQARIEIPLVRAEVEATGARYRYALVSRDRMAAPNWLRARLGLPEGCPVLHLACAHFADDFPFQYEDRWINLSAVSAAARADFAAEGPNEWLVANVPLSEAEIAFSAVAADAEVAANLSLAPGEPVFLCERTTRLDGEAITLARLHFGRGYRMTTVL
ncbi:UTRA domain-containing protein [Rhodobacterales bacterium HKCCE2091]|nr:UTRA domain-containing protein [Rhodobacterales bacterium HKCCE2091]